MGVAMERSCAGPRASFPGGGPRAPQVLKWPLDESLAQHPLGVGWAGPDVEHRADGGQRIAGLERPDGAVVVDDLADVVVEAAGAVALDDVGMAAAEPVGDEANVASHAHVDARLLPIVTAIECQRTRDHEKLAVNEDFEPEGPVFGIAQGFV